MSVRIRMGAIIVGMLAGSAGLVPQATAATYYTAEVCGAHTSHGMCLGYKERGFQGAWDASPKDNETLDKWYFPGNGSLIANSVESFLLYPTRCTVTFYTKTHGHGSLYSVKGNPSAKILKDLPETFIKNTYSFRWTNC